MTENVCGRERQIRAIVGLILLILQDTGEEGTGSSLTLYFPRG
ncbi:MAG: hypothetical protein ACK4ND_20120 [Cytophagaceae bacterium]